MRLLVTGGAGYIGGVVTLHLLRAGHQVTVLDDLSTGHADAVPDGATFVPGDVTERPARCSPTATRTTAVLHFAAKALVAESVEHPERYWRTNVAGTLALLDAMRANAVPRLVFSSTAATYGEPDEVPIPETAPTRPTNPYGATKLAVDMMITAECAATGSAAVSLRYFNVAGRVRRRTASGTRRRPTSSRSRCRWWPGARPASPSTATTGRPRTAPASATTCTCRPGRGARAGAGRGHRRRAPDLQPRQRRRLLGARGGRGGAAGHRAAGADAVGPRRAGDPAVLVASARPGPASELGWTPRKPDLARDGRRRVGVRSRRERGDRSRRARRAAAGAFRDGTAGSGTASWRGARPGQPDRRAHRLQRRLRAAARPAARRPPRPSRRRADGVLAAPLGHGDGDAELRGGRPGARARSRAGPPTWPGWSGRSARTGTTSAGGVDVPVDSDVPEGAGLSSSAALECSVARRPGRAARPRPRPDRAGPAGPAGRERVRRRPDRRDGPARPRATARTGTRCSWTAAAWRIEQVPFDPAAAGLAVLGVDSRRRTSSPTARTRTAARACEQAARVLGRAGAAGRDRGRPLAGYDGELLRRARHVVTENARVLARWPSCCAPAGSRTSARCCRPRTPRCGTTSRSPCRGWTSRRRPRRPVRSGRG